MTFDLEKVLQSKRKFRQQLAARPVAEKLAMLDTLRERALALRGARTTATQNETPENHTQNRPR